MSGGPAVLLERSDELSRVGDALASATAGEGRLIVLEGPSGIGKSALLAAAAHAAEAGGMCVLSARGSELEREYAFGVVRQLFEPVLLQSTGAERALVLDGSAGLAAGLLGLPGAPRPDRATWLERDTSFAVLHSLYALCANLAARSPLLLVLDDADWADAPSLRYLAFLLTRLPSLAAALIVAKRPSKSRLLEVIANDPAAERIQLQPLTNDGASDLLAARLGKAPDPVLVDAFVRTTGGTPSLLNDLAEAVSEGEVSPTADAAPEIDRIGARLVGRSLQLRLSRLSAAAGELARALAVLEQADLPTTARVAGLDGGAAADACELLVSAGFIASGERLTFVHSIVRSGLYAELTGIERSRAHARAARVLEERSTTGAGVADHLLLSDPIGEAWALAALRSAAARAISAGALEQAAAYLRRALDEPASPPEQWKLLLRLGSIEASGGLDGWYEHLRRALEIAPGSAAAARTARVFARALSQAQRFGEAVDILDHTAARLDGDDPAVALEFEAAAVTAGMIGPVTASSMAARRLALRDEVAGDPDAAPELLGVAALISILMNEPWERGAALARRALAPAGCAASEPVFARTTAALLIAERYSEIECLLDESIARARETGDSGRLSSSLATRARIALRRGDLGSAEVDARTALGTTGLPAPSMYRVLNGGILVKALVDRGALDEAEEILGMFADEIGVESITAGVLRVARGRLRMEQGHAAAALTDFLDVGDLMTRMLVTCPGYLPWRSEAALAHLALGDRASAARLAEAELALAETFGAARARGMAKRAVGLAVGGDRGEELLREAVADFEAGDAKLERARALADLGAYVRRRNRRVEARTLLRQALDGAHNAGAKRLAEQAETELRATGARLRSVVLTGVESLTASERRVAELAGSGHTNREIAQQLFITARTVEGHLTNVFRKLQLDSRNKLQNVLAAGE